MSAVNYKSSSTVSSLHSISALDARELPRHRWYFFKEAFSPSVVECAVRESNLERGDLVFDPFSGSGTVPLTASQLGFRAYGSEVNPFLAFVARTKLVRLEPQKFKRNLVTIESGIKKGCQSNLEGFSTFSQRDGLGKWLFNHSVLRAFEGGWEASTRLSVHEAALVQLALIGAAMDTCNAAKDGKCLRYRKGWKEISFSSADFLRSFQERCEIIEQDLVNDLDVLAADVVQGDSRKEASYKVGNGFKLCVTSPPYLNSFDYTDVYRPELFLGKFVGTKEALRRLRYDTIRSHVQANWDKSNLKEFGSHFSEVYRELLKSSDGLWDRRIPDMVCAYFEDMSLVLSNLRKSAAPRASLWLTVSTSAYAGLEIPVDLILGDIGVKTGWRLREVSVMRYLSRVSGQQWKQLAEGRERPHLRESIVIFDAC